MNDNKVYKEKSRFVEDLWKALKPYYPEIESMEYVTNGALMEYVVLSYVNGSNRRINVTFDSLSAMLRDVSKWL